jgi:transcriptional regulator GlxA family with amidase domain
MTRATHRVAVLALDAVLPLDLGIPTQVFGYTDELPYRVSLCAVAPGEVRTTSGFRVRAQAGLATALAADTIVVPGFAPHHRAAPAPALDLLATALHRGRRLVSICTGAFALAEAGVLDGRRATTHWRHAAGLAAAHPAVRVDPAALYVDEGQVLTSAGVAAGIDLCLHLIARDLGAQVANRMARRIVAAPHRDGGQAQYIDRPVPAAATGSLGPTRAWALEHLDQPLTIADLARHAHCSPRSLSRRFAAETGLAPLRWLTAQRVGVARELLETSGLSVDEVARRAGLGSAANLRLHFRRRVGAAPAGYRKAFSQAATGG